MASEAAKKLQSDRNEADRVRHTERLEWLSGDNPAWACGTPVQNSDIFNLSRDSRNWLGENAYRFASQASA